MCHAKPDPFSWHSWNANWLDESSTSEGIMVASKVNLFADYLIPKFGDSHCLILQQTKNLTWWFYHKGVNLPNTVPWMFSKSSPIANAAKQTVFDATNTWAFKNNSTSPVWTYTMLQLTWNDEQVEASSTYTTNIKNTLSKGEPGSGAISISTVAQKECSSTFGASPTVMFENINLHPTYALALNSISNGLLDIIVSAGDDPMDVSYALSGNAAWWRANGTVNLKTMSSACNLNIEKRFIFKLNRVFCYLI